MCKNRLIISNKNVNAISERPVRVVCVVIIVFLYQTLTACNADISNSELTSSPSPIAVDLQDRSWLTGEPCTPPCWHGLYIDVSSEEEVISTLEFLPFVDSASIETSTVGYGDALTGEHYNAKSIRVSKIGESSIRITVGKGNLKQIGFGINYEISIGEVVEQIGVPDVIRTWVDFDTNFCDLEIYWLEKQLIVTHRFSNSDWLEKCQGIEEGEPISHNLSITYVELIYNNWLSAMMKRGDAVPWPGFSGNSK